MSATYSLEEDESGGAILSIHFNVPENHIALETFVSTADSAWELIDAFNSTYFRSALEYQLFVLPPEGGTFLSRLGIWSRTGASVLVGALLEPSVSGVIKSLTGHEPTYWAEQATDTVSSTISDIANMQLGTETKEIRHKRQNRVQCELLINLTTGFLSKSTGELESLGFGVDSFPNGFVARNNFYDACIANSQIRAIGFSKKHDFPIPRSDFESMRIPIDREEDPTWKVQVTFIRVSSPNWDRGDRRRRWKGKDSAGRECHFTIEDEHFWALVHNHHLNVSVEDSMKVQWAYQEDRGRQKSFRVLRVLEYNGLKLAEPLNSDSLDALLGLYELRGDNSDQLDLFK